MLSQETLSIVDFLTKHESIDSLSINFASYSRLPEISIQSKVDVSKEQVIDLISHFLCPIEINCADMDFDHCNCWGDSYNGKTADYTVCLITSTTKKETSQQEEVRKENLLTSDYTSEMEVAQ